MRTIITLFICATITLVAPLAIASTFVAETFPDEASLTNNWVTTGDANWHPNGAAAIPINATPAHNLWSAIYLRDPLESGDYQLNFDVLNHQLGGDSTLWFDVFFLGTGETLNYTQSEWGPNPNWFMFNGTTVVNNNSPSILQNVVYTPNGGASSDWGHFSLNIAGSTYAGKDIVLCFAVTGTEPPVSGFKVDNIFTNVPEPTTLALLGLGLMGTVARAARRRFA